MLVAAGSPQRALATPREVNRRFGYLHRVSSEVGGSGSICGRVSGGPRRGLCEWGGGRCDDGAGGAGFGHGQTTPWCNLTIADKMARADLLLRGGQSTKNASDTAAGAGGRSTAPAGVAHTGQGVLRGRETGSQPTGGDVAPTWAHHHHQGAWGWYRRRPEHAVGWRCWLAGDAGTHPDSQSHSLAGSRRRAGKGAARRCPGGAERRQAGRRHSTRGPVSPRARQAACRGDAGRQLTCPTRELLQHPTRQVGSRHATHATTTRHGRHGAPARHVGRRVTRQAAAVTQHSARPGGPPADGHAAAGDDQAKSIREKKASLRHGKIANPPRGNCEQESIRLTPPQSAGTARNRRPTRPRLQRGSAPAGRGPAPPGWSPGRRHTETLSFLLSKRWAKVFTAFLGAPYRRFWQGLRAPGLGWF